MVHRLQREFPRLDLVLAAERKEHGSNRKVNNLINMMALARHDYLMISDSDVKVELRLSRQAHSTAAGHRTLES